MFRRSRDSAGKTSPLDQLEIIDSSDTHSTEAFFDHTVERRGCRYRRRLSDDLEFFGCRIFNASGALKKLRAARNTESDQPLLTNKSFQKSIRNQRLGSCGLSSNSFSVAECHEAF
jgi:hypothetical protein